MTNRTNRAFQKALKSAPKAAKWDSTVVTSSATPRSEPKPWWGAPQVERRTLTAAEATALANRVEATRQAYANADQKALAANISEMVAITDAATDAWFARGIPMDTATGVLVWVLASAENAWTALGCDSPRFDLEEEVSWIEREYPQVRAARYVQQHGLDYDAAQVMVALETINEDNADAF